MRQGIARLCARLGIGLTSDAQLERLQKAQRLVTERGILLALPPEHLAAVARLLPRSTAQLRQDLFALAETGFRRGGYFVEFGATNGLALSNTWLLETEFGWTGILAEAARSWHAALRANRKCEIDERCLWPLSQQNVQFREAPDAAYSSTVLGRRPASMQGANSYEVRTVSLMDLLGEHGAPRTIDYLSLDTEGSEYDILSTMDFQAYRFRVITCEHNYGVRRADIHQLLTRHDYVQVYEEISQFDDWYVHKNLRVGHQPQ